MAPEGQKGDDAISLGKAGHVSQQLQSPGTPEPDANTANARHADDPVVVREPVERDTFLASARAMLDALHACLGGRSWELWRGEGGESRLLVRTGRYPLDADACIQIPLEVQDGRVLGVIHAPESPEVKEVEPVLAQLGRILATLLDTERAARRLEHRAEVAARRARLAEEQALTDGLTGLPNRRAWERMLAEAEARATRYAEPAAVLALDLDDLKTVNDREGHLGGDLLIRVAADVLARVIRRPDRVARVGGDEFGLIAIPCGREQADVLSVRLRSALAEVGVEASLGVEIHDPERTLRETWNRADAAMYHDKQTRRRQRG